MMNKGSCFLLFLLCIGVQLSAQEKLEQPSTSSIPYSKPLKIDLSVGTNIDLSNKSANPVAAMIGGRNKVAPVADLRFSHFFSKRFGWYAGIRLKFYEDHHDKGAFEEILTEAFKPLSEMRKLHPAYDLGLTYRLETNNWRLYPRIGFGQSTYGSNRKSERRVNGEGVGFETKTGAACLTFGLNASRRVSTNSFLFIDAFFQQPITKASAYIHEIKDDVITKTHSYKSSTLGRELNLSIGLTVLFGKTSK